MLQPCVIFDRDGTLYSVDGPTDNNNQSWANYNARIRFDAPVPIVHALWHAIRPGIARVGGRSSTTYMTSKMGRMSRSRISALTVLSTLRSPWARWKKASGNMPCLAKLSRMAGANSPSRPLTTGRRDVAEPRPAGSASRGPENRPTDHTREVIL